MKNFDELKKSLFEETAMAEKLATAFSTSEIYAIQANTLLNLLVKLGIEEEYLALAA